MRIYKETTKLFVTRVTMILIAIQHKLYISMWGSFISLFSNRIL